MLEEELRVCAFFDALGTQDIMLGEDAERRTRLITLIRVLQARTAGYSSGATNVGFAVSFSPTAQVTTFSDNVAISFPLKRLPIQGAIGNEPHTFYLEAEKFFEHLLLQTAYAVWEGLKIGVLFRGGVSIGRLVHDDQIIAGEALVNAVLLEKATCYPRIELSKEVLEACDENNTPLVTDYIRECLIREGDRWFFNALAFHIGYWRDHNFYRNQRGEPPEEIPAVLSSIRQVLDREYKVVKATGHEKTIEKWRWFIEHFEAVFNDDSSGWQHIAGAREAAVRG